MAQTASLQAVTSELRRRMGYIPTAGDSDCRPKRINGKLRPDKGYSEHAFDNAEDLKIYGYAAQKPYLDMLEQMRSEGYPVGLVLHAGNRPSDHTDHIHLEGDPCLGCSGATPPCAGGAAIDPGNNAGNNNQGQDNNQGESNQGAGAGIGGSFGEFIDKIQEAFNNTIEGKPGGIQSIPGELIHQQLIIPVVFSFIAVVAIIITSMVIAKALVDKSGLADVAKGLV